MSRTAIHLFPPMTRSIRALRKIRCACGSEVRTTGLCCSRIARSIAGAGIVLAFSVGLIGSFPVLAQDGAAPLSDYTRGPDWFPSVFRPYRVQTLPDTRSSDSVDLQALARDGKIQISLEQLRAAVLGNNLEIASARHNRALADTDVLRARGGGAPRGAPGVRIPSGLFAGAIGAGVGDATSAGGATGAGGITGSARQVVVRPRGSYDPSFALNFSLDRTLVPLNTLVVAGVPIVQTSTTALQVRFAQAFTTGTSISVSFNNQRQSSSQLFLRYNPAVVSFFSFTFTQQLLNGFGRDVNRRFLTVAENGQRISDQAFREQVIASVSDAEVLYWDLVAARDNVRVAENALAVASQFLEDNRAREEIGTVSKMEVFTAESEVAARRRDLVAAQAVFDTREAELKSRLTRDLTKILEPLRLDPVDSLPDPTRETPPRMEDALSEAVRNRPELRQAEMNLANQDVAVRYTANLLKPTLVLFGMLNSAGLYGNRLVDATDGQVLIPGGLYQTFGQVGRFEFPEYAFGFSLQIPLLNRSAQADNIRARIEKHQVETSLEQMRTGIQLQVRDALVALTQSKAQVESAGKAVELGEKSLHEEEEKLQAGLSTPYELIRRQRDLVAAQFGEVTARTTYAKARVALNRATGKTIHELHE